MINIISKSCGFLLLVITFLTQLNAQNIIDNRGFTSKIGDPVPNLLLNNIDGDSISLHDLKGKVVVLQFTASWCSVCRQEMPHLEKEVWLENKDKDFVLIGIDIDEDKEKVIPFIRAMMVTYPIAYDADKSHFYNFATLKAGVTRNIVIDKEMNIAFQTRLYDPTEFEEMKRVITSLLY
jgi:peroxiredoxin